MNIELLPIVHTDLEMAMAYYDSQSAGLGDKFYHAFLCSLDLIAFSPQAWSKSEGATQKFRLSNYPYTILYVAVDETILITGVLHQSRDPRYFQNRY